jgi:hypothetical protein
MVKISNRLPPMIIHNDFRATAKIVMTNNKEARRAVPIGSLLIRSLVRTMNVDSSPRQGMTDISAREFKTTIPTNRMANINKVFTLLVIWISPAERNDQPVPNPIIKTRTRMSTDLEGNKDQ